MSSPLDCLDDQDRDRLSKRAMPGSLSPMLAVLTDKRFSDPDWIFERKFDGERILAFRHNGKVSLRTRNSKEVNDTYPELVDLLADDQRHSFIADGEVVAFEGKRSSFARLQQRMQISDPDEARASRIAVYFYLFDLLQLNGWNLEQLPLRSRKRVLRRAVRFDRHIRFTPHRNRDGEAYFGDACEKGWEGIIAKRADASYRHSRSRDWLKFKCANGQELVIAGFTEPSGSRTGFGALLVGYYDGDELRYAGKVGTGYDDEFLRRFRDRLDRLERKTSPFADPVDEQAVHWVSPKLVGEFGFTEWTRDGKLRHPRFLGLRRDKKAKDVIREVPKGGS